MLDEAAEFLALKVRPDELSPRHGPNVQPNG